MEKNKQEIVAAPVLGVGLKRLEYGAGTEGVGHSHVLHRNKHGNICETLCKISWRRILIVHVHPPLITLCLQLSGLHIENRIHMGTLALDLKETAN